MASPFETSRSVNSSAARSSSSTSRCAARSWRLIALFRFKASSSATFLVRDEAELTIGSAGTRWAEECSGIDASSGRARLSGLVSAVGEAVGDSARAWSAPRAGVDAFSVIVRHAPRVSTVAEQAPRRAHVGQERRASNAARFETGARSLGQAVLIQRKITARKLQ